MRLNVVPAASALLAASLLILSAAPALAGDAAIPAFIGYSADGHYFAFEEFGVQDGSGFAYSNIYVVDLPADTWVNGSPFRSQAGDQSPDQPLDEVRAEAMGQAREVLDALGVRNPVDTLWLDGSRDGDGKAVAFSYGPILTEGNYLSLTLTTSPATSSLDCVGFTGHPPLGFKLTFAQDEGAGTVRHDDGGKIPASRGCATDYRIHAVVRPVDNYQHYVAIIATYPFGFEGPDRRFLAVPLN